ncbi:MAG: exodeoxyribonuclease VII small subunit [Candidatus Saccharimonadales bacterium]
MSGTNKTIQDTMAELDAAVAWFQSEEFSLEEALPRFKDAEKLAQTIEAELVSMKNDITIIKEKFDS